MEEKEMNSQKKENIQIYKQLYQQKSVEKDDRKPFLIRVLITIGFAAMCLLLPLISLFFYIIWRHDRPKEARWIGFGTVIGFVINISIELFVVIFSGLL